MADHSGIPGADLPEDRARTVHNLKFIGWAMHNFTARNGGRLPSSAISKGGEPLLSWRVAILPWLEQSALHGEFHLDEAWDSPHNLPLLDAMPRVYAPVGPAAASPGATYYQAI